MMTGPMGGGLGSDAMVSLLNRVLRHIIYGFVGIPEHCMIPYILFPLWPPCAQ